MADNRNDDIDEGKERSLAGLALSLGFSIAVPLTLFILGGVWLDSTLNTRPIFILLGIFLGLFASGYSLWQLLDLSGTKSKKK